MRIVNALPGLEIDLGDRMLMKESTFPAACLAVAMSVQSGAALSEPGTLTGYCIDLREAGCTDRFLPFYGMSVDYCEETCTLRNPVPIRGLEATLYDRECVADYDTPMEGRVLLLSQHDWAGNLRRQIIDEVETFAIVPCP